MAKPYEWYRNEPKIYKEKGEDNMSKTDKVSKWDSLLAFAIMIFLSGISLIVFGVLYGSEATQVAGYGLATSVISYYFIKKNSEANGK